MRQLAHLQGAQLEVGADLGALGEKGLDAEHAALLALDAHCAEELRRVVLARYPDFIAASQVGLQWRVEEEGHLPLIFSCFDW